MAAEIKALCDRTPGAKDASVSMDDGKPELIGRTPDFSTVVAHFMPIAGGFAATNVVTFPFNDCGC